jgi:hypothetical protein
MPIKTFIQKTILATSGNRVVDRGLNYYVNMLKSGQLFTFSRYGDGEWNAILGVEGANCDGHPYFPELGEELRASIIKRQNFFYALQPRAIRSMRKELQQFLSINHIKLAWHNADVFHDSNKHGRLFSLIDTLRSMNVIVVGPAQLRKIKENVFDYKDFIEIPTQNCYLAKNEIRESVLKMVSRYERPVFAFSASMATKVLIYELFPLIGSDCWLIDFGSLWDVYVGNKSRNVYLKRDWEKIIQKNIHGKRAIA